MSTKNLAIYLSNALLEAEELEAVAASLDVKRVSRLCQCYRIAAIASLLMTAKDGEFRQYLSRSGRSYAAFVARSGDGDKLNSASLPFFDALAANDSGAARAIAERCAAKPNLELEYEEDYLYFTYLMRAFVAPAEDAAARSMLERYAELASERPDLRFDLCAALASRDSGDFEEAFSAYLDHYQRRYADGMRTERILPETFMTEGRVSVEGLGLVALAEARQMRVDDEYAFVPSVARARIAAR